MRELVARWRDEEGDATALGALRVVIGALLLGGALRAWRELGRGYFGDVFHWPLLPEALVPSKTAYAALIVAQALLATMVLTGRRGARPALAASAVSGAYVLMCDRLQFHNNRWALDLFALLLSLTPCDRSARLGGPALPATGPMWAARLYGVQLCLIYVASGGSKLLDPDWRGGQVILERLVLYGEQAVRAGVPAPVVEMLAREGPTSSLAKLAIATELALAFALWSRRLRPWALWVGVWFHGIIELTASVEGFSWLMIAGYAVFAKPDARARSLTVDATRPAGRLLGLATRRLDWLGRFDVREARASTGHALPLMVAVDRDGLPRTGLRAWTVLARGLPALFPLWGPLAVLTGR